MSVISRVGRKGVIVIPKRMREFIGLKEGSHIVIELGEGEIIIIRPFTLKRVKLGGRVSQLVAKCKKRS
mgnify:CR=1 FL=1